MKPYYEDTKAGITIYHGDCRDVLPSLAPDSADLIVTDPPYGVKWRSNYRNSAFEFIANDQSADAAVEATHLACRVLRRHRHAYVFGRYDISGIGASSPVELIWDKGIQGTGDLSLPWGKQHEYIQFFVNARSGECLTEGKGKGKLAARMRRGSVLRYERPNGDAVTLHPTEKPLLLLRELIESSSRIGDTVLDYFCGSGSTLEAARIEGRRAIGIEIEERYAEIAAKRLSQEVLDFGSTV